MKIRVIGCGGIAGRLLDTLCRFLNYHPDFQDAEISLIDGDTYEEKNRDRQAFDELGNKAEVTAKSLELQFPSIYFRAHPTYIDQDNIIMLLREGDLIFSCVDNHATRKLVSDHCEELDNVVVISGGNDYIDGNVQVHIRKDGENLTLPIANEYHPEIEEPEDESPADIDEREGGCDVEVVSEPQLLIANNYIAAGMLNAFYSYLEGEIDYDEAYLDVLANKSSTRKRS